MADVQEKPMLVRLVRADPDLAFRARGEVVLMRIVHYGRAVARVAFRTGGSLLGVAFLTALVVAARFPWVPAVLFLTGLAGVTVGGLTRVVALLAAGPVHTARAVRMQLWSRVGGAEGGRALVRGRVTALRTVKTLDGRAAVFVRKRATRRGRGAELQQGEDFLIDDGSGSPVRVAVGQALLLDRPKPVFGSWMGIPLEFFPFLPRVRTPTELEEAVVAPGDMVEVIGRVETVVDPMGIGGRGRETPMVRVVSGTTDEPLLLRTVAETEAAAS